MFRCAAPGYVSALYQAAGLREVAEWDVGVELVTDSPAQYWEMISEHVSLAAAALAQASGLARERIAKAVIARASAWEQDGKVRIPGVARCIIGTKQERLNWLICMRRAKRPERAEGVRNRQGGSGPVTGLETPLITLRDVPQSRARDRRR
jgi:hypothetical protein